MSLPALSPAARLRWDVIERRLDQWAPPAKILEVGAGSGAVAARLDRLGEYVGVEPDDRSRTTAAGRVSSSARMVASIENVTDTDFDLLTSFEVLEHLDDDAGELSRWVGHLRPGARVLVSVPAHRHRFAAADVGVGHLRRYDPSDLHDLLAGAGLVDIEVRAYGFPLGYLLEWARNLLARRDQRRGGGVPDAVADRTAGSGRLRQPPSWAGALVDVATWPFRLMQRINPLRHLGPGLVGSARVAP
jgi:SAM-dependent methyltransferase